MKRDLMRSVVVMAAALIVLPALAIGPALAQSKKGPPPAGVPMAKELDGPKDKQKGPKPPPSPEIHITFFVGKPLPEVWKSLIDKTIVDKYYILPLKTLEQKVGGKIAYGPDSEEVIVGKVTKWVPPDAAGEKDAVFEHTFKFVGSSDPDTTVTYTLKPIGKDMCAVSVDHMGYKEENETFAEAAGGWPVTLSSMKTLLETGKPLPWPTRAPGDGPAPSPTTNPQPDEK